MLLSPLRVGVVFGGDSGEHAVSIRSARTVIDALRRGVNAERYLVSCFYIDRAGRWWPATVAEAVLADGEEAVTSPADAPPGLHALPEGADAVQVWFPMLHGPNGEDGTIQGLFTLMRRPFVGSGVLGSALGMDKQAMKAAFAAAGLPQVPYACVLSEELEGSSAALEGLLDRLEAELGYPCFVKPANLGSSVGISKARDRESLLAGLRTAAALDPRIVVERGVTARELECAVLGGGAAGPLRASVLGEIRFSADWYDYETKYSEGLSHTEIPAQVPTELSDRARQLALAATRAVAASGLARVDFFWEEARGQLWLNEINTMPGFTSQSMYPMLWAASGLPLEELVHELVLGARQ
jgi:D-alanine-D-alanine ligase